LNLIDCDSLMGLNELSTLAKLTKIKACGDKGILTIKPLLKLLNLTYIDLGDCFAIRDFDDLSKCISLQSVEFDIDLAAAAVLFSCYERRAESDFFCENHDDHINMVRQSKQIDSYIQRLVKGYKLCIGQDWLEGALRDLIGASRSREDITQQSWLSLLDLCLHTGDKSYQQLLVLTVDSLDWDKEAERIISPWLEVMSRIPKTDQGWALQQVKQLLAPIKTEHWAKELSPAICLFYTRLGCLTLRDEWLHIATSTDSPFI